MAVIAYVESNTHIPLESFGVPLYVLKKKLKNENKLRQDIHNVITNCLMHALVSRHVAAALHNS